jgi:uncharacterized membrane protein
LGGARRGARARRAVAIADAVEWIATAVLFAIGIANGTVNTLAALWIVLSVLFGAAFVGAIAGIVTDSRSGYARSDPVGPDSEGAQ